MKKITVVLLLCMLFCNHVFAGEIKPYHIKQSDVAAMGAILMDADTGRVLWEKNSKTPLPMASTTKIMTAVIALENGNLDDIVKVSKNAVYTAEVKMHLSAGEEITLRDLLYALMLQSYNDAAVAVAEHISGDVESFCELMTKKAREIGAYDTIFETPNGLDKGEHHSTAYDMALITGYALGNGDFTHIINTMSYTAKSNLRTYELSNKNRLLREFEGANGVKTGFTGKSGHCFVGAVKRGDMQLISVVLASGWGDRGKEQKWVDTKQLLKYGFDNYHYMDIIKEGVIENAVKIGRSKKQSIGLYLEEGLTLPVTDTEKKYIRVEIEAPDAVLAPVLKDDALGFARVYIGKDLIKQINIRAAEGAERHDFETSLKKVISDWINMASNDTIKL